MGKSFGENSLFWPNIFFVWKKCKIFVFFALMCFAIKTNFHEKFINFAKTAKFPHIFSTKFRIVFVSFRKIYIRQICEISQKVSKVQKKIFAKFRIFRKSFRSLDNAGCPMFNGIPWQLWLIKKARYIHNFLFSWLF